MNLHHLFPKRVQTYKLSRRTALKGTIIGAAALFPVLEEAPGVSAASLGFNQSDLKVQPLTGTLLRQELTKFQALPQFASAQEFVSQQGYGVTDPLAEGYYLYQRTGGHWSKMTFLTLGYTQGTAETAAISYMQSSQSATVNIVTANLTTKTGAGYSVHESGTVESVARLDTRRDQSTLQLSQQYEQALQSSAVNPQISFPCTVCGVVCHGISTYGCSILGAAFTCGEVCIPLGENPVCLSTCAVAFYLVCTVGITFSCVVDVCVNALHVC